MDDARATYVAALASIRARAGGWEEIAAAIDATAGPELAVQKRLRDRFADDEVRAALTLRDLRQRFGDKFSSIGPQWYDRLGAEQATPTTVADHKARKLAAADDGAGSIFDLCGGIGADAVALGRACSSSVVTVDRDEAVGRLAAWNVADSGLADRVEVRRADAETVPVEGSLLHLDPDRRAGRPRSRRVEDYVPDLDAIRGLMRRARGGAVKLGPASNFGGKFDELGVPVATELVSLGGECKEATVWFGSCVEAGPSLATVLPAGATLVGDPLVDFADRAPLGRFLFDPDPAVVRAGLVDRLGETAGLARLDEAEEYLTGDEPTDTPFATPFEVLDELPNNDRAVRAAVRSLSVASVEIKCRHLPVDADAVRRKLPLGGEGAAVLIYARIAGRARVVLARRPEAFVRSPA